MAENRWDRIRAEDGFAVPTAVVILSIVLLVAGVTAVVAIASLSDARRDRSSSQAFEAADSAIDVVTWQFNRHAVVNDVQDLLGYEGELGEGVLQGSTCISVEADVIVAHIESGTATFCAESIRVLELPNGSSADCLTELRADLDATEINNLPNNLLTRRIVCVGESGDSQRVLMARLGIGLLDGVPISDAIWERHGWVECTSGSVDVEQPESALDCLETELPPIS